MTLKYLLSYFARFNTSPLSQWWIPLGLVLLSMLPVAGGAVRIFGLGSGGEITPANQRFFSDPLPVVIHIVSSSAFCLLGAFQFAQVVRRRHPRWHKLTGRLLAPLGLIAATSGLWLTLAYPQTEFDGESLLVLRVFVGVAMFMCIVIGLTALRNREFKKHGAWMKRGYALGLGAGTQAFTLLPLLLIAELQREWARTLAMAAGWTINLIIAEWSIRQSKQNRAARRRQPANDTVVPRQMPSQKRALTTDVSTVALLLSVSLFSTGSLAKGVAWKTLVTSDGITVKHRFSERTNRNGDKVTLVEDLVTTTVTVDFQSIVSVMRDASLHKRFMGTATSKKIKTVTPQECIIYYYSDNPWPISDSDSVIRMRLVWSKERSIARFLMTAAPSEYPDAGVSRSRYYNIKYTFEDLGNGKVNVTVTGKATPPFEVPRWILNASFPDVPLKSMRKLLVLVKAFQATRPN